MIQDIDWHVKAGYPTLWVRTPEPDRLLGELAESPITNYRQIFAWDCNRGYRSFREGDGWSPFSGLEEADPYEMPDVMAKSSEALWVLFNYHWFMAEPKVIQGIQNNMGVFKAKGVTMMVVSPEARVNAQIGIPKEIEREMTVLDFALPTKEDLGTILDDMLEENEVTIPDETRIQVLDSSQGLTWSETENAMALSLVKAKTLDPQIIMKLKAQMVEKNEVLEFSQYAETFANLGGLEVIKTWTINRFQRRRSGLPFRGIMILGVPGTGKSHFAKALANEVGWPCLSLAFGRAFGSLVGESEAKMRGALMVIDAMAPAVVFIDEIDKGLGGVSGPGGDGGTTKRVGGIFLSWMQDRKSDVFVIATANDIAALPAEYKRTGGRWDAIFFVDIPNLVERKAILDIYLKNYNIDPKIAEEARRTLPPKLEGYTGAEISQVCVEMGYGQSPAEAANFVIPLIKADKVQIDAMREAAKSWQKASIPETSEWGTKRKVKM